MLVVYYEKDSIKAITGIRKKDDYKISSRLEKIVEKDREVYEEYCRNSKPEDPIYDITEMFNRFLNDPLEREWAYEWVKDIKKGYGSIDLLFHEFVGIDYIKENRLNKRINELKNDKIQQKKLINERIKFTVYNVILTKVVHLHHTRKATGRNFWFHELETAELMANMNPSSTSISLDLRHDTVEERTEHELEHIKFSEFYEKKRRAIHDVYYLRTLMWMDENISEENRELFNYFLACDNFLVENATRNTKFSYAAYQENLLHHPYKEYWSFIKLDENSEDIAKLIPITILKKGRKISIPQDEISGLMDRYKKDILGFELSPETKKVNNRRLIAYKPKDHTTNGIDMPIMRKKGEIGYEINKVIYGIIKSSTFLVPPTLLAYINSDQDDQIYFHLDILESCKLLNDVLTLKSKEVITELRSQLKKSFTSDVDMLLSRYKNTPDFLKINPEKYCKESDPVYLDELDEKIAELTNKLIPPCLDNKQVQLDENELDKYRTQLAPVLEEKSKVVFNGTFSDYLMMLIGDTKKHRKMKNYATEEQYYQVLYQDAVLVHGIIEKSEEIINMMRSPSLTLPEISAIVEGNRKFLGQYSIENMEKIIKIREKNRQK